MSRVACRSTARSPASRGSLTSAIDGIGVVPEGLVSISRYPFSAPRLRSYVCCRPRSLVVQKALGERSSAPLKFKYMVTQPDTAGGYSLPAEETSALAIKRPPRAVGEINAGKSLTCRHKATQGKAAAPVG